jgi:oligoendopeptidase F
MVELYNQYYGIDLNTEPLKKYVWCYIPHLFHSPFYVYQYATSFASSLAIYEMVKNNEPNAFENYLKLLKAGGSTYPVDIIKGAGVDLTNKESFMAVVDRISDLVNQLEKLLEE